MGFLVKGVKKVVGIVGKVVFGLLGPVLKALVPKVKRDLSNQRLNKTLEPEDCRKIIFGKTASALDVRFWQVWGSKGTKYDEVLALASHRINSVQEFYCEDELAINAAGVVQAAFAAVLSRNVKLGAALQTALVVGDASQWNANSTFDEVAHMVLHWIPDEKKLPNGVPSKYTQVIEGCPVYDPRRDSTVPGGSGTHRINDTATWAYATLDSNGVPIGRNNCLQALTYIVGWKATQTVTAEKILTWGRGVEPEDINLATFISGANNCEVAQYYTDMILSTEDAHTTNEGKITCNGLIGQLIDAGGLWSYYANVDDTATIAVDLIDDDILQDTPISWNEYAPMSQQFVQVAGKCIDPSPAVLYQLKDYPLVRDATYETNLGSKKRKAQDYEQIQDPALAQKLSRLLLNAGQYQGEFGAGFMYRALRAQAWSIVRYTSERFNWVKLFRVMRQDITQSQGISMTLQETHSSIWGAGAVSAAVAALVGTKYDPRQEIAIEGLTATAYAQTGAGAVPTIIDGVLVSWTAAPENVRRTEVRYQVVGRTYWESSDTVKIGDNFVAIMPLISGTTYVIQARHISIHEIAGPWIGPAAGNFTAGSTGNLNYASIKAAADAATAAQLDATTALTRIANVTNDALLDKSEKPGEVLEYNRIINEYAGIIAQAAAYGVSTATYTTNKNALVAYETALSPAYNDYTTDTTIVRATYNQKWTDYYDARQTVLNNIATAAGLVAAWPNVTDPSGTRPANNADVTLTHTSAGFVGQAPIATDTDAINRIISMRGGNFARNGFFTEGQSQFFIPSDAAYITLGAVGDPAPHGIRFVANPANNNNSYTLINSSVAVPYSHPNCFVSFALKSSIASQAYIQVVPYDASGAALGPTLTVNVPIIGSANWQRFEASFAPPAGTASINVLLGRNGALTSTMTVTSIRVAPSAIGADITLLNISSGFTGQAPAATDTTIEAGAIRFRPERALNRNSAFTDGLKGWINAYTGTVTQGADANGLRGATVAYLDAGEGLKSEDLPCTPGETVYVAYRFKTATNRTAGGVSPQWYMGLEFSATMNGGGINAADAFSNAAVSVAAGVQSGVYKATVPAGCYAMRARPVLDNGLSANGATGWIDYCEIHRDEPGSDITGNNVSSGFLSQGALSTLNAVDPSTSNVLTRGSVPPSVPNNAFTYTSTTTTITVSWPNITVYRADGTNIVIGSGSQAITGLTLSTTYKLYPYAVDNGTGSGTMSFVTGGSGSPTICFVSTGNAVAAATMAARGNIPLNGFTAATTAAGSGGGGGGGSSCYHERNLMTTARGIVEAGQLVESDHLLTPSGWQPIRILRRRSAFTWIEITSNCVSDIVVPEHVFYRVGGEAVYARELRLGDLLESNDDHVEITGLRLFDEHADKIMTELDDPHLYFGGQLLLKSHNPKP